MFDPFLVKMGPIVVMALFLGLAALAMAPALREVGAAVLDRTVSLRRYALARLNEDRRQLGLWARRHTPCAVFAGRLSAVTARAWRRR